MGSGEKSSRNFHLHLPHLHHHQGKKQARDVPKGCLAIKVGSHGEEQQRFVVPVFYFNHPLFIQLLKEAEEEYGFDQKGTITIPCHVEEFRNVQPIHGFALVDEEGGARYEWILASLEIDKGSSLGRVIAIAQSLCNIWFDTNELLFVSGCDVLASFAFGTIYVAGTESESQTTDELRIWWAFDIQVLLPAVSMFQTSFTDFYELK
ncbi:hypothetical protein V6N13_021999 [Hibiscus sabdariffa]